MSGWQWVAQTVIGLLGPFLVWLLLRRSIERNDAEVDDLRGDLKALKDRRLTTMEGSIATVATEMRAADAKIVEDLNIRMAAANDGRRTIHGDIAGIRAQYVTQAACAEHRELILGQTARFHEAVVELARTATRVEIVSKQGGELLDRLINTRSDLERGMREVSDRVAKLEGRHG